MSAFNSKVITNERSKPANFYGKSFTMIPADVLVSLVLSLAGRCGRLPFVVVDLEVRTLRRRLKSLILILFFVVVLRDLLLKPPVDFRQVIRENLTIFVFLDLPPPSPCRV